jgi:hypothetical protein
MLPRLDNYLQKALLANNYAAVCSGGSDLRKDKEAGQTHLKIDRTTEGTLKERV